MWQFSKGIGLNFWRDLEGCKNSTESECLEFQIRKCKTSQWVVTKEVRTSVKFLESLLRTRRTLKIVFLVRDPRAVIHSRRKIWTKSFNMMEPTSKALCNKILNDLYSFDHLNQLFPDQLYKLHYEEMVADPINKTRDMYRFLGYSFAERDAGRINHMTSASHSVPPSERAWSTVKRNSTQTAMAWRATIPNHVMHFANKNCFKVINQCHYPALNNVHELRDQNMPLICTPGNNTCGKRRHRATKFG